LYISNLEASAYYGPMKLTRITYKTRMNCGPLKLILKDLTRKKLVEEKTLKKNIIVYVATPKSRKTISHFEQLKEMLLVAE